MSFLLDCGYAAVAGACCHTAAWSHVRSKNGGALKEKFVYMTQVQSKSKKIAIVATARKLAELMYTLLKKKVQTMKKGLLFQ